MVKRMVVAVYLISLSMFLISQELPVKKVVIYKNGISYIEREASLDGDGSVQLKFRAKQMRDVLKTLFAIPVQKGTIQNIDYQSEDPMSKKLEDIRIPLPVENTLTGLLKGLQGVRVKIIEGSEKHAYTILGVETKKTIVKDGIVEEPLLVLMKEETNQIQSVPIDGLQFTIEDENIKKDFNKLLSILNSVKYADQKTVSIYYKGFEKSPIKVGYVIESPIWKTTYRIFLDAKPSALLQSFAIVENDTLDDWKDVEVTLVGSGPFSYLVDLYTTIIPSRPTISIDDLFGIVRTKQQVQVKGAGGDRRSYYIMRELKQATQTLDKSDSDEIPQDKESEAAYGLAPSEPLSNVISRGLQSISRGKGLGEYFSYEITEPVTILRSNAGLINILSENVDGDKILYYKESESPDVFNAFYLKNNTKNVLDNGFVTFFEGQSTVGEGYLKTQLKAGEKEVITYGIEKSVSVETNMNSNHTNFTSIKLTNGMLVAQYYSYNEKVYKIFNKSQKAYALIIDHLKRGDWELREPTDANIREDLPNIYRFKVSIQPNTTTSFKVVERKLEYEYIYFDLQNLDRILYIISSTKLSANAKKIVEESVKILKEIAENDKERQRLTQRNNYLHEQLKIIRENIYALNTSNPQEANIRSKHVEKLDKYITEYEENENKRDELTNKKNNLLQELSKLISSYSE